MAVKLSDPRYRKDVEKAQDLFVEVREGLYDLAGEILIDLDLLHESNKDSLSVTFSRMIYRLGYEFYRAGRQEAIQNNIVGLASAIRSGIENTADLKFILGKSQEDFIKRASKYVQSHKVYDTNLIKLASDVNMTVEKRAMHSINPWTTSSIQDRVSGENAAILATYDWMSHFSHPNPGILNYYWEYELKDFHCKLFSIHNSAAFLTLVQRLAHLVSLDKTKILATKVYFRKITDGLELLAFVER